MKVRVYIATTEGPSEVQRITEEDADVKSVVCLDGKAVALPISAAYDAFVRDPTGVIQKNFGHGAFRMDVARPITGGMSWQLGAYVAHALFKAGRLAKPGEVADRTVWLSGEVNRDLEVGAVEHVAEKISASQALFASLSEPPIIAVPEANKGDIDPAPNVMTIERTAGILRALDLETPVEPLVRIDTDEVEPPTVRRRRPWWLAIAVVAAIAVFWRPAKKPKLDPPPTPISKPAPAPLPTQPGANLLAVEVRPPGGEACAAIHFETIQPRLVERTLKPGTATLTKAQSLCRLGFRIAPTGDAPNVWLIGARSGTEAKTLRVKALLTGRRIDDQMTIDVRVPKRLNRRLLHRLAMVAVVKPNLDLRNKLDTISAEATPAMTPAQWTDLVSRLKATGSQVLTVRHQIIP